MNQRRYDDESAAQSAWWLGHWIIIMYAFNFPLGASCFILMMIAIPRSTRPLIISALGLANLPIYAQFQIDLKLMDNIDKNKRND